MQNPFFLILLILFSIPSLLTAQVEKECTYAIEGRIYDLETKQALSFVTVQIEHTAQGSISDDSGYFIIDRLCEKEYDLVFTYLGYKTIKHHQQNYRSSSWIIRLLNPLGMQSVKYLGFQHCVLVKILLNRLFMDCIVTVS